MTYSTTSSSRRGLKVHYSSSMNMTAAKKAAAALKSKGLTPAALSAAIQKIASAYGVSLANITFSKVSAPSVHWSSSSSSSSSSTTETTMTQHITVQGLDHTLYTSGTNESTVKKVYTEAYTDSVGMSINGTLAKGNKITHKFAAARRASSK